MPHEVGDDRPERQRDIAFGESSKAGCRLHILQRKSKCSSVSWLPPRIDEGPNVLDSPDCDPWSELYWLRKPLAANALPPAGFPDWDEGRYWWVGSRVSEDLPEAQEARFRKGSHDCSPVHKKPFQADRRILLNLVHRFANR